MDGQTRREKLLKMLKENETPLSGSALAGKLGVSRQIIVSDIALLRAGKQEILSTARGYLLYCPPVPRCTRCFPVSHTDEQMEDELNAIVDLGGRVLDVLIDHPRRSGTFLPSGCGRFSGAVPGMPHQTALHADRRRSLPYGGGCR